MRKEPGAFGAGFAPFVREIGVVESVGRGDNCEASKGATLGGPALKTNVKLQQHRDRIGDKIGLAG